MFTFETFKLVWVIAGFVALAFMFIGEWNDKGSLTFTKEFCLFIPFTFVVGLFIPFTLAAGYLIERIQGMSGAKDVLFTIGKD